MSLKNTLNQIIPHIRFFEIPSKDFYLKVWPFKKVLSQAFVEDILSFHMTSALPNQITLIPRHGRITVDSTIINSKHTAILNNWIQREDANAKISNDSKYDFTLIYRGSRDGFDSNPVICSCKGGNKATLLIIKISDDDETILGGYNPIGWKYNNNFYDQWASTSESFIFSFKKDLTNAKISRVLNGSKAIYESSAFKFNFGNSDLVVNHKNKGGTCKKRHYESSILDSENFMFEEMEHAKIRSFDISNKDQPAVFKNQDNDFKRLEKSPFGNQQFQQVTFLINQKNLADEILKFEFNDSSLQGCGQT
ncbi:3536_t:CDS:2 [Funneliformis mosseae]|uniref:3536_t:CDS:1 n=1 Tax=Funneliformis mosseae TaxID=27381 RepID=A0A9N8WGV3_FUNMO|nr:3536_t:CDS:2 [Funneliformis mosseae]